MVAYMNREAFEETLATGHACYFSRSRNRLWRKGEESGNFQTVHEIRIDCDHDTILLRVEQHGDGAACHEGYESCFFRVIEGGELARRRQPQGRSRQVRPGLRPSAEAHCINPRASAKFVKN